MSSRSGRIALASLVGLAFVLRAAGFERVFPEPGAVVFAFGDPYYHLRLALYAFRHFPDFLSFDAYLNFPTGAAVPWPPLYDLVVAGSARGLTASQHGLEVVAAWWPPWLAALTTIPVYALGRACAGVAVGVGAAGVYALLPASSVVSRVGYADHHAAVTLCGASLLALHAALLAGTPRRRHLAGLALARASLVLIWPGSLAYLAIAEVPFVLAAAGAGRRAALRTEARSLVVTAALVTPFAAAGASPEAAFAATHFSWLQPTACLALAVWAALARHMAGSEGQPLVPRMARVGGAGALLASALLLIPGVREALGVGAGFVSKADLWGSANPEQMPLFANPALAETLLGYSVWGLPLAPALILLLARRERGGPRLLLACWCAAFTGFALSQIRFANDVAAPAAVALALLLQTLWVVLRPRLGPRTATGLVLALGAGLLAPSLARHHALFLGGTLAHLRGTPAQGRLSPELSMHRFATEVGRVTPETAGFLDASGAPEYGILSDPSLGHALHYLARRATPADNFGPYGGSQNFMTTLRLLLGPVDAASLAALERLRIRYVVTNWQPAWRPASLLERLHEYDGRATGGLPALGRFRLVLEGPENGKPLAALLGAALPARAVPYKLFEVVRGAVLVVEAPAGERVRASVTLVAGGKRRFVHRVEAVAGAGGRARLRVPYATRTGLPVRTDGPYRVRGKGITQQIHVDEQDVRRGRVVPVPPTP